jgi:hypothetical protein
MNYQDTVTAVNQVIRQYTMPLTLRQIYYRLVAAGLIPNRRSSYNGLSAQLVKAREEGDVNAARIVDRHRSIEDRAFDSPQDFFDAAVYTAEHKYFRRFWKTQPVYVETWVEKDALSQVISDAVQELNTIVAPSKGYASYSYIQKALDRFSTNRGEDVDKVVVLYLGDHDPSGLDMTRDLQERFNNYGRGNFFDVEVKRIALNYNQVRQYNLLPAPTKIQDSRAAGYMAEYGNECWELDALDPNVLVDLARTSVEGEVQDWDAWDEAKEEDESERQEIKEALEELAANHKHD